MKRSLVEILQSRRGDGAFELTEFRSSQQDVEYGILSCQKTGESRAILSGFPLLTEVLPNSASTNLSSLQSIESELFGDAHEYQRFVEEKWRRPNRDEYAAFQPFNESTRALYPLIPLLRSHLRPGDYVLDTWCRTGWSGELLAALFPEQNIISIWEGNHGVLGYRAFRHWLGSGKRAPNLDILFHDVNSPLPFTADSIAAVIGLDTWHRYDARNLVEECQRICPDNAPILFPHVHLTNSEPDPWFDRGCRQEHGEFWSTYLSEASVTSQRVAYVESEMALFFASGEAVLESHPSTHHYNALVGLVPAEWMGAPLGGIDDHFAVADTSYVLPNPLLDIDLNRLRIGLRADDEDGMTDHILSRHPGYREFLKSRVLHELSPEQARILYWAGKVMTLGTIAEKLRSSSRDVHQNLAPLIAADIILVLPISAGMAQLNHYFANQEAVFPAQEQNLVALWNKAVRDHGERAYVTSIADGFQLSYAELDGLVSVAAGRLRMDLSHEGEPVCVVAKPNLETVVLFWASQRISSPFVAIDPNWAPSRIAQTVKRHQFTLLFSDISLSHDAGLPSDTTLIAFESGDAATSESSYGFDAWLERETVAFGHAGAPSAATPSTDSIAVVLFTSGTTGGPKGVEISHQALWQSARNFAEFYRWCNDDIYLSLGDFSTISGLRNPLVSSACVGSSFLIPDANSRSGVLETASLVGNYVVTVMGVVPAFIKSLAKLHARLDSSTFRSLRYFLCTAANLAPSDVELLTSSLGVPVHNYYGLTETCGACIFRPVHGSSGRVDSIGRPFDAIAQIVDRNGKVVTDNASGELRIYSGNLMSGYLNEPAMAAERIRDGWLYTGDFCRWSDEGVIEIRGRREEVVKALSGALVSLTELEQCLARSYGNIDLAIASFIDEPGYERLACFVQEPFDAGENELLSRFNEILRESMGSGIQLSSVVGVDSFPRGANEKIQRRELVRLHTHQIGGQLL